MSAADKLERKLQRAWARAAEAGDAETLEQLRSIFEGRALGLAVWATLTASAVGRVESLDWNGRWLVLPGRCVVWPDFEAAEDTAERLGPDGVEEARQLALGECYSDLTLEQERFLERQVERAVRRAEREIRAAVRRCVHPDWRKTA